ncbi:SpoIIE family protein phosphatase [Pseudomonas sp. R-28-1W-6]|jgi:phosphoserine phosphatase RsbU/P|uniref:two-component system response regulator RssB n=1 Tax=Pseudomonas sp. R-28-1W-6 TaxID=2650101 RepID=UPI0013652485|nr:two-component system response regulator RssB [Pseudomonas sp. R-28-1W-6]MWV13663.1 SpoIIE family protein phosphatase [Pseudomonas sp. R-28-1W-6]
MHNPSAKLLIIDDDEVVRASLAAYLEDSGFSVLQASNGLQGLEVFELQRPDLVICDLRMPQVDGLELIRRINALDTDVPVVVVSGAGVMSDVVEALRLGAADYLIKPLEDLAVLEHSVHRALDRAHLRVENQRYREKLETANRELQASLHLLEEDQNAGRQVQMNMLPVTPWQADGLNFAHHIIPSLYLSGDFVDYFRVDERRIVFYLADVSGHGASSAFVTVLLKFMTTRLLYESRRGGLLPEFKPSDVLGHINRGLINCKLGKHVTMLGGVIDEQSGKLTYSIGGHLPLPVLYSNGQARYLEGRGLPVGLFEEAVYSDLEMDLPESFSLTLLSDGILDLLPGETLKDKETVLPQLVCSAGGTLDGLRRVFGLANLGEMPDDIALLVLSRNLA